TDVTSQQGLGWASWHYASPEHIGRGEITPRSDVYSLGAVLYELLTGERPLRLGTTLAEAMDTICDRTPTRPSERMSSASQSPRTVRISPQLNAELDSIVLTAVQ